MKGSILEETKSFTRLFTRGSKGKIITWNSKDAVGISILRNYPDSSKFVPAKNAQGNTDTVILIKVGYYYINENDSSASRSETKLIVSAHKASKFLLEGHMDFVFDKENKDSPTKESLNLSKASLQPIDLEESTRFEYYIKDEKIKDTEINKYIKPSDVVDYIYNLHLKTLTYSAFFFRLKIRLQTSFANLIFPFRDLLLGIEFVLFGRTIRKSEDFAKGVFEPYERNDLVDSTTEKVKILGSDFPITNQTARTFVIAMTGLFLINRYTGTDILGFVGTVNSLSGSFIFGASIVAVILLFFDRVLPLVLFWAINLLIYFNLWLIKKRVAFR